MSALIDAGICVDQNWPSVRSANHAGGQIHIVSIAGVEDLSFALKNVDYDETYREIRRRRSFNLNLIDGGLIQMLYTFQNGSLVKHLLSFSPSPDLLEFQNNSDVYETDTLYSEVIAKNIVVSPLRIDFDPRNYREYHHPMSHLTMGQYKNCRIPVSAPFTPYQFINLILRAFYNTAFNSYCRDLRPRAAFFDSCITDLEKSLPHLCSTA